MSTPAEFVQFQVRDIVHPTPAAVLSELYGDDFLQGEVVGFTNDGRLTSRYVVVRVPGVSELIIVPAGRIRGGGATGEPPAGNATLTGPGGGAGFDQPRSLT